MRVNLRMVSSVGLNRLALALKANQGTLHAEAENFFQQAMQVDLSYGEDSVKTRKENGPENLSIIRRRTMNLLKTDTKAGMKNRRAKAGWDRRCLLSLLEGAK